MSCIMSKTDSAQVLVSGIGSSLGSSSRADPGRNLATCLRSGRGKGLGFGSISRSVSGFTSGLESGPGFFLP